MSASCCCISCLVRFVNATSSGLKHAAVSAFSVSSAGFAAFARPREFRTYVDYVIEPSYKLHQDLGLLTRTMSGQTLETPMSFRNFLSGRMLWDESMAYQAYRWTQQNPGGLLLGLVGADHGACCLIDKFPDNQNSLISLTRTLSQSSFGTAFRVVSHEWRGRTPTAFPLCSTRLWSTPGPQA